MEEIQKLIPKDAQTVLVFFVNGKKVTEPAPDPEWTLLWYLRRKLRLTGTKYGCGEGGCGACTVMVSQYNARDDKIKHIAVNACLTPVCAMHGLAVTTVEGIGSSQEKLHAVQERIAKSHGSQCGFCTPGIVMSMYALLRNKTKIQEKDIETAFQGNLCRCTGYRPIIEGLKTFIEAWETQYANGDKGNGCLMGEDCCKNKKTNEDKPMLYDKSSFQPYDPTQEPIFPPELKINTTYQKEYLCFKGESVIWLRPQHLHEILSIKKYYPHSKIVGGNTEIGVEIKFKKIIYPILLSPSLITEMNFCSVTNKGVKIGSSATLTEIAKFLQDVVTKNPRRCNIFEAITDMLHWFAGNQVRNVASLAGNIITASPISDLNPILMASNAVLNVYSMDKGHRQVVMDESFFKGYRKTVIEEHEILMSIEIPFTKESQFFKAYKQAKRKEDDISIVTAAFNITLKENNNVVEKATLCYGGMGPTTKCATKTSKAMQNLSWNQNMINVVYENLLQEFELDISVPGGLAEYRKSLCLSLFFRFYVDVFSKIQKYNGTTIPPQYLSAATEESTLSWNSSQYYEITDKNRKISDSVGKPVPHMSAFKQACGEALYCDDIPYFEDELFLTLVFSTKAHAEIVSIDASKALSVPGVVAFLSALDLEDKRNKLGPIFKDEEIFASKLVTSRACVVGAVIAKSESAARKGKDLVSVTYNALNPVIVTIEDAIRHKSYFSSPRVLKNGDVVEVFKNTMPSRIIRGYVRSGAQEHFYLETMSAFAIRREDELEIISSTQNPAEIGHLASQALGIPNNKVVSKVKRLGGGFGGKETRATILAIPVAIASYKLKKPVRAVLDRDEDMQATGYRHPCLIKYQAAFDTDGRITAAKFEIYANAGNSMDISCSMMERIVMHLDNCYFIPNIDIEGYLCKTNMPSNTAFRGFGGPQAMFAMETLIRDVASALGKDYEEIADLNLYREGHLTHFNQCLTYCTISRCWKECIEISNYWKRKKSIEEFNKCNRWKKMGISILPTKYGISFQGDLLMQGGALVLIYTDGSILISIGGIEMGQGLFTKMIQVASRVLEVDISKIHISEMATNTIPNSSPTAASMSSDIYGMAVVDACTTLTKRLEPYKTKNPTGTWEDWVMSAYFDRVHLSATGFYVVPKIEYNPETNSGNLFEYFTYGVACSEVLVDCLTGDHTVLRTDIVMDLGESLNPAIDIGQIEGAFTQGYGYYTIEEMVFSPTGELLSRGPGAYKIPGFSDIPKTFNVSLLKGAPNPRAVYSSKAVGEPPLFLAASVFFAIKEAIRSAREDAGVSPEFVLETPATCARIRMACEDEITQQVTPTITRNGKPWNVVA
ncbi:xanthine dehydrogenase-like [Cydia pomonella]|uniref:xanthine dehydrogenase-like n=1 Tax=Cydia pomonella TaxID=82600 RepID=UPI002ADD7CAC|nr:xanthine dehydrogenase-like [Cydia pomonella]